MSSTIATLAGNTGLGSERQIIWAANSANYWAFGYTGTSTLSTWYSPDGVSWTAGATHALSNAHNSEGRNLAIGYKNVSGVDVVHIALPWSASGNIAVNAIRATISGTTITFHSSETAVASGTSDGGSLLWASSGLEFDSNNKLHLANGFAGGGNGDVNSSDSTADAGTAEQMTPVTWTAHVIDSSVATENRSAYVVSLGSGNAGLIADDGSGHSTTTGLDWHKWNGSSWNVDNTNQKVTGGAITAIDKNDWGAVAVSATDVHVVYRNASGSLVHRRFDGTNWNAGQSIPAQNSLAGGGVALTSDGASVWLCVIDTDSANTIRFIRWSSITTNGITDTWDTNWQAAETSSQTRTWIGCARDVQAQTGLVYWSEGSNFVASTFQALPPEDPVGAWIQSNQGSTGTTATTFAVTFTTQNIVAGNRIIVAIAAWNGTATTVTSVTDSAGNQYAKDKDAVESDNTHISIWSAPITAGGGTKPTVTAHASATTNEWAMWVHEYSGLLGGTAGYLDGTNSHVVSASTSPFTSSASTPAPGAANEIAFGFYGDGGNNITTIGVSAGWTQRGTSIQATSTTAEGACEDQVTVAGTGSNASFTLSNTGSPAGALVAVYKLALSSIGIPASDPSNLSPLSLPTSPYAQMLWAQPAIVAAPLLVSAPANTIVALQKRPPIRSSLFLSRRIPSSVYNSGGVVPVVLKATQKRTPIRPNSLLDSSPPKWLPAPVYNSGGIAPTVLKATQKKPPTRPNSILDATPPKWIPAPVYNSGGLTPLLNRAIQRPRPIRANSRIIIATPSVVLPGTAPVVSRAVQKPRPTRASSRVQVAPVYNSGGIQPSVLQAVQKRRPTRANSRPQIAPVYNSGGILPAVLKAVQKPKPQRANSRVLPASVYNSGGLVPSAVLKVIQKPPRPTRANSRTQIAPLYNSGGIRATLVRSVQKARPFRANSRFILATPTVQLPGTQPLVSRAVQKPRTPRSNSRLQVAPQYNSGGLLPIVRTALRRPPAKPVLPRFVIAPVAYVPVFIRPNPLAYPLAASAIALPGQQGSSGQSVYGLIVYGVNAYGQVQVSSLAVPLTATARSNPVV